MKGESDSEVLSQLFTQVLPEFVPLQLVVLLPLLQAQDHNESQRLEVWRIDEPLFVNGFSVSYATILQLLLFLLSLLFPYTGIQFDLSHC